VRGGGAADKLGTLPPPVLFAFCSSRGFLFFLLLLFLPQDLGVPLFTSLQRRRALLWLGLLRRGLLLRLQAVHFALVPAYRPHHVARTPSHPVES